MSEVKLNVRYATHNARNASSPEDAIRELCKAIEHLDDNITELRKEITGQTK